MTLSGETRNIFPQVKPKSVMASQAIPRILSHANQLGMEPLNLNHVRFFVQPKGFVDWAVDVDLAMGTITRYPGRREKTGVCKRAADPENFASLKRLLTSDAFRALPAEGSNQGVDGCSYFIEVNTDGIYSWKCYWSPDEQVFHEIRDVFKALSQDVFPRVKPTSIMASEAVPWIASYAKHRGMAPLEPNHVRFFLESLGFVVWAVHIDLAAGRVTQYPSAHVRSGDHQAVADSEKFTRLCGLLRSDRFKELPAESSNEGIGGCSYFIEVDIGGIYSWKCHWSPGDQVFLDIAKLLECLSRDAETIGLRDAETKNRDSLTKTRGWSLNHWCLGDSLQKQGKFSEAIKHYEQAVGLEPKDCYARASLASALMQQGKVQEAIEHFVQALTLPPKQPYALYNLGCALERAGRVQEAEEQYEQAFCMDPEFVEAHISSGNGLLRQGKPQEAIPYYEQTLQIKPYYTQIHFNLGRALEQVGRVPEAIEQYEQARSCRPDLVRARNALTRLRAAQ